MNCQRFQIRSRVLVLTLFIASASLTFAGILAGPVLNKANGHVYYLLTQNTWTASEAEAETLGGRLATVNSKAENDWIFSRFANFGGQPRCLWIGCHRWVLHGKLFWVGNSTTYTNWAPGEPNDYFYAGEPESYVHIWAAMPTDHYRALRTPGTWNDLPDLSDIDGVPMCGVVEIPFPRFIFLRPQLTTASEAITNAPVITAADPTVVSVTSTALTSQPQISPAVEVSWPTETNNLYQVQWTPSLEQPNWTDLQAPVTGTGANVSIFDSTHEHPQGFYRVQVVQ